MHCCESVTIHPYAPWHHRVKGVMEGVASKCNSKWNSMPLFPGLGLDLMPHNHIYFVPNRTFDSSPVDIRSSLCDLSPKSQDVTSGV